MPNKWKCPYCNDPAMGREELIEHLEAEHEDFIPEGWSPTRLAFKIIRKKDHGTCVVCGNPTEWNEKRGKYQRLCDNPACRKKMREDALRNHIKVYHCETLLNDMDHQDKMLKGRHISGQYTFRDGGKIGYVGSFEKKFLEFMDTVLECDSKDIMEPGPVLEYEYDGKLHKWITDFLYIPYNLIIEVKDGGSNPNMKSMPETRAREHGKDVMITSQGEYNYLKLTNNNFRQLLSIFVELKQRMIVDSTSTRPIVRVNESVIMDKLLVSPTYTILSNIIDLLQKKFPILSSIPELSGDKGKFIRSFLSKAKAFQGYITREWIMFYIAFYYTGTLEVLASLIIQSLMIPANAIGQVTKFIYDWANKTKPRKNHILPVSTKNIPKGYKMICVNTHILNILLGSIIDRVKIAIITRDTAWLSITNALKSYIQMTFLNGEQWDARDFMVVNTEHSFEDELEAMGNQTLREHDIDIVAVNDGIVVTVIDSHAYDPKFRKQLGTNTLNPLGSCIIIMHQPGLYSTYAHLKADSIKVKLGDVVKQGDVIAKMGNTGNTSCQHLHFEFTYSPKITEFFSFTMPMTDFDFQCIPIPGIGVNYFNWEKIDKYKNNPYIRKKGSWIPEITFVKEY